MDIPDDRARVAAKGRAIRTGWGLWFRALPATARDLLPVAAIASLALCASGLSGAMHGTASGVSAAWLVGVLSVALVYGIALVGAILSEVYTGSIQSNPYLWTARRLVCWAVTWWLYVVIMYAGFILLVIPGLILGVRLFWADEYTLIHGSNPFRALKESWSLTKGQGWNTYGFQFLLGFVEWVVLLPTVLAAFLVFAVVQFSGLEHLFIVRFIEGTVLILLVFIAYGSFHAPEIVYFYGLEAQGRRTAARNAEREPLPGTQPAQPGTQPAQPGAEPAQPGAGTARPATGPTQSGAEPAEPETDDRR